jgi:hypothetical protein
MYRSVVEGWLLVVVRMAGWKVHSCIYWAYFWERYSCRFDIDFWLAVDGRGRRDAVGVVGLPSSSRIFWTIILDNGFRRGFNVHCSAFVAYLDWRRASLRISDSFCNFVFLS